MSESLVGDTSKNAVSQYAEKNRDREVLTKQVNAGQQTVVATEPSQRDDGSREVIIKPADQRPRASQSDVPFRKRSRIHSRWETLFQLLVGWYYALGLRIVLSEGSSCFHRIGLRWRTRRDPLWDEEVNRSCPRLSLTADESRNERSCCTLSIQALTAQRPWMSLGDIELFLQGWFQAQRLLCRTPDSEHRTADQQDP